MAKLPTITRIRREDIQEAPPWIEKLLQPLNQFMEGVYGALNRNLTFGDNLASSMVDLEFTAPTGYGNPFVAARYSSNAAASYGTATTIINFEDKEYDTHDAVTVGAAWKFTAPTDGYYNISANVGFQTAAYTASHRIYLSVYKNGTEHSMLCYKLFESSISHAMFLHGAAVIKLAAGDEVSVKVANERGSTATHASPAYMFVDITSWSSFGRTSDDFGTLAKFKNPLKEKPKGVFIVSLKESDDINEPIYEATSVSWRINFDGQVEVGYIPGLKAGTSYKARLIVA